MTSPSIPSSVPSPPDDGRVTSKARGGLSVTFFGQGLRLVSQMLATLVMVRWLSPSDFGIVGIAIPISGVLIILNTTAFSVFVIQRPQISDGELSVVFWLNLGVGAALTSVGFLVAPWIAWLYGNPDVQLYVQVLSCGALVQGALGTHEAVMARRMAYRRLMAAEAGAAVVGAVISGALAVGGAGPWALVFFQFGTSCLHAVAAWGLSGWTPQWVWDRDTAVQVFKFGSHLSLFNLINFIGRNSDDVLIGWWLGEHALGLYMLAYRLLLLPSRAVMVPVTRVVVASLSRLQEVPKAWGQHYLEMMTLTMVLSLPIIVVVRHLAEDMIGWLFGENWLPAVAVFMPLSVVAVLHASYTTFGWIWVSRGETSRMRNWAIIAIPISVSGLAAGLPWGIEGVATGYAVVNLLLFLPGVAFATKTTVLSVGDFLRSLRRPVVSLLSMEGTMQLFGWLWPEPSPARLIMGGVVVGLVFLLSILALYGKGPMEIAWVSIRGILARPKSRSSMSGGRS